MQLMQFSVLEVAEFQKLWKEHMGTDISADQAREYASNLTELINLVYPTDQDEQSEL